MSAFTRLAVSSSSIPILAYAVSGEITDTDVRMLRADLDAHERVRVLLCFDASNMPGLSAVSPEMMAVRAEALSKAERLAVVGGPGWMPALAATAGALTPFSVQHFQDGASARGWLTQPATPDEMDDRAEAADHGAPAVSLLPSGRPDLLALAVDGTLTAEDYERTVDPAVEAALAAYDEIDLLVRLDRLGGVSFGAVREDAALAKHLGRFRRMALIGGPGWLTGLANGLGALVPVEVRTFVDEAAARAWLGDAA